MRLTLQTEKMIRNWAVSECGSEHPVHDPIAEIDALRAELKECLHAINEMWDFLHQLRDQGGRLPGEFDTLVTCFSN